MSGERGGGRRPAGARAAASGRVAALLRRRASRCRACSGYVREAVLAALPRRLGATSDAYRAAFLMPDLLQPPARRAARSRSRSSRSTRALRDARATRRRRALLAVVLGTAAALAIAATLVLLARRRAAGWSRLVPGFAGEQRALTAQLTRDRCFPGADLLRRRRRAARRADGARPLRHRRRWRRVIYNARDHRRRCSLLGRTLRRRGLRLGRAGRRGRRRASARSWIEARRAPRGAASACEVAPRDPGLRRYLRLRACR